MLTNRLRVGGFAVMLLTATMSTVSGQSPASRSVATPDVAADLGNGDVIKLAKSGLSDAFIVARIRQAASRQFDLSADAIIALRTAGISEAVLTAMLETTASAPRPERGPAITAAAADTSSESGIYLEQVDGRPSIQLEPTVFSQGKTGGVFASAMTYGIVKAKWKAVVRSPRASIQTRIQKPAFIFRFTQRTSDLGVRGFAGWLAGAGSTPEAMGSLGNQRLDVAAAVKDAQDEYRR